MDKRKQLPCWSKVLVSEIDSLLIDQGETNPFQHETWTWFQKGSWSKAVNQFSVCEQKRYALNLLHRETWKVIAARAQGLEIPHRQRPILLLLGNHDCLLSLVHVRRHSGWMFGINRKGSASLKRHRRCSRLSGLIHAADTCGDSTVLNHHGKHADTLGGGAVWSEARCRRRSASSHSNSLAQLLFNCGLFWGGFHTVPAQDVPVGQTRELSWHQCAAQDAQSPLLPGRWALLRRHVTQSVQCVFTWWSLGVFFSQLKKTLK